MELTPIYSVPLWTSEYPDFEENKESYLEILRNFKNEFPQEETKSNRNGYHSPDTVHRIPELAPLFEYICQLGWRAVTDLNFNECKIAITSAWVNFNDNRSAYHCEHVHEHTFSGVFYVKAPEGSGKLNIINPAINNMWIGNGMVDQKNQFTAQKISIEPVEGNILLFPSYVSHAVETNDHDDERIAISFNMVALENFEHNVQTSAPLFDN